MAFVESTCLAFACALLLNQQSATACQPLMTDLLPRIVGGCDLKER